MTLRDTIKLVKDSAIAEGIYASPDMILEVAGKLFVSQNISDSKRENIKAMKGSASQGKTAIPEPPSPKQIKTLTYHNLPIPATKQLADAMIKDSIAKSRSIQ